MLNTKKAYRMLVVVLFFAFISLISRSIIYLVLSVAIATIILFLLSGTKKSKNEIQKQDGKKRASLGDQNIPLHKFLIGSTIIGALVLGYGSLHYKEATIFHQWITVPTQPAIAIVIMIAGFSIVVASLYFILKEMLTTEKTPLNVSYCGFCGSKNKRDHLFCSKCGKELK